MKVFEINRDTYLAIAEDVIPEIIEELEDEQAYNDKYFKKLESKTRRYSKYEAINDFREELLYICWDKLKNGEDVEHFSELRIKAKNNGQLKVESAKNVSFQELFQLLGIELKRDRACCPICASSNQTTLHVNGGAFYCFKCSQGGDVISFIMKLKNLKFIEAVKYLQDIR